LRREISVRYPLIELSTTAATLRRSSAWFSWELLAALVFVVAVVTILTMALERDK
jgi:prepilin signal peptidase PulO-like enzyme (type II secretory pathway)